jgi:hypothetical protein
VCFEKKKTFSSMYLGKKLAGVVVVNSEVVGLGPDIEEQEQAFALWLKLKFVIYRLDIFTANCVIIVRDLTV